MRGRKKTRAVLALDPPPPGQLGSPGPPARNATRRGSARSATARAPAGLLHVVSSESESGRRSRALTPARAERAHDDRSRWRGIRGGRLGGLRSQRARRSKTTHGAHPNTGAARPCHLLEPAPSAKTQRSGPSTAEGGLIKAPVREHAGSACTSRRRAPRARTIPSRSPEGAVLGAQEVVGEFAWTIQSSRPSASLRAWK